MSSARLSSNSWSCARLREGARVDWGHWVGPGDVEKGGLGGFDWKLREVIKNQPRTMENSIHNIRGPFLCEGK